jgi:hypothetical protein
MQSAENQVSRGQRGGGGGGGGGGNQQQLNQLDLQQNENRYETQREAQQQQQQTQERSEQLQVSNRLSELARRQEGVNERMQELQTALQQARTEQEKEQARKELKRLQEDQQQLLSDVDELRQRMDSQQNQTAMSDQRQQLDQVRQDVQRAADAAAQGSPSQALAAGTRAERGLQQAREDLRKQTSSQFEEQMRDLRAESRTLSGEMRQITDAIAASDTPGQRRSLADGNSPEELMKQLEQRKAELNKIVDQAKEISTQAENTEPLLAQNLDETVRKVATDDQGTAKEFRQRLAEQGQLSPGGALDRTLQDKNAPEGTRALDLTREMLRTGDRTTAMEAGRRAQAGVDNLRDGIEKAAASVLGDDAQALRFANDELNRAIDQATNEAAQGRGQQGQGQDQQAAQNQPGQGQGQGQGQQQAQGQGQGQGQGQQTAQDQQGQQGQGQQGQQGQGQGQGQGQQQAQAQGQGQGQQGQGQGRGQQAAQNQPGQGRGQGQGQQGQAQAQGQQGQGRQGQGQGRQGQGQGRQGQQAAQNGQQQGGGGPNGRPGDAAGTGGPRASNSALNLNNLTGGGLNAQAGAANAGPITGEGFAAWSDGLRNVEEIVDTPEWRNAVAAARERARLARLEYNRTGVTPDWAKVELDIIKPLTEVRQRIAEDLARRNSDNPTAVIDRDPVPARHSASVQKYSEEIGKGSMP